MGDHNVSTDLRSRRMHRRKVCKEALGKLNDVVANGRRGEIGNDIMTESASEDKDVRAEADGHSVIAICANKVIAAVCAIQHVVSTGPYNDVVTDRTND